MSRVNHLVEEFAEQNLLLQMVLGVLSETERVERLLPRPTARAVTASAVPTLDRFAAALLGIVSLRQHIRAMVSAASSPPVDDHRSKALLFPDIPPNRKRRRRHTIRELMR